MNLSQGFDLDCTEAEETGNSLSVSLEQKTRTVVNVVCIYLSLELTIEW